MDNFIITDEEYQKILRNIFDLTGPLKLKVYSPKLKKKITALRRISEEFEPGREYSEKEVNALLKAIYPDFATLRRNLIDYGCLDRRSDCSVYWKK